MCTVLRVMEFDPRYPKWVQIADVLRERIASGEYPPRHMVSELRLEQEFGVARVTIRKVTRALRAEGLITTHPGMGSFVADDPKSDSNEGATHGE